MKNTDHTVEILDPVRGVAILLVLAIHALVYSFLPAELPWHGLWRDFNAQSGAYWALMPICFGWAGVAVFFVVSGFCIHLSHMRSKSKSWAIFGVRRFFRIFPPYALALVVFAVALPYVRNETNWGEEFLAHLFLVHNFNETTFFGITGPFWSIAVEAQLYLLYPMLLLIVGWVGWTGALWIVGVMEVTLRLLSGILACVKGVSFAASGSLMMPPPFSGSPLYFWFSWAIGAALAEAFLQRRKLPFHMSFLPWLTLAIAVYFFKPFAPLSFLFFAVATVCFLSNRVETKMPTGIPGVIWGRLGALGIISYSVYLLHDPIVRLIVAVARRILPNSLERPEVLFLAGCSAIVPVVLVSWGFYVLVERPSIAIGKKIIDVSRNKMCALGETQ